MTDMDRRWHEQIVKNVLDVNTDTVFIIDKFRMLEFPGIKNALLNKYSKIIQYESEIKLRILLKNEHNPIIIQFSDEKEIPYHMLSTYVVITLDTDKLFPLFDKKAISELPLNNYQAVYELYIDEIPDKEYDRLSEEKTRQLIQKGLIIYDATKINRITELHTLIEELLDNQVSELSDWIIQCGKIAEAWGELQFLVDSVDNEYSIEILQERMNKKFVKDVLLHYDYTVFDSNLPVQWNILERIRREGGQKKAVVCFDCMGFEEWNVLKEYLNDIKDIEFDVGHTLAVIPTETNFSRTTIFSGMPPKKIIEMGPVNNVETKFEEKLFKQALVQYGIVENDVYYQKATISNNLNIDFDSLLDYEWIGVVFTFMDTLAHNKLTSKGKLVNDIREYLTKSNLTSFIEKLIEQDFQVFFVSDHGNIFAKGNGVRVKKDLVDDKANRFIIFRNKELAREYETENTELLQLINIIGDQWLLFVTQNEMFDNRGQERITHGGISVEEVVVPFVKVSKI